MKLGYEKKLAQGGGGTTSSKKTRHNDDEDVEVLKTRIKDLEKEVQDAKNYYLKKVKDSKKGGPVTTAATKQAQKTDTRKVKDDPRKTKNTAPRSRSPSPTASDDKKENRIYGENLVLKEEKSNILSKLLVLPNTYLYNLLS